MTKYEDLDAEGRAKYQAEAEPRSAWEEATEVPDGWRTSLGEHATLDALVKRYLEAHPGKLPSTTLVTDLLEWSGARRQPHERGKGHVGIVTGTTVADLAGPPAVRLVIVGEDNPYEEDPKMALFHLPRGASGDRLRVHLGMSDTDYRGIPKMNLCKRSWDPVEAVATAEEILDSHDVVVCLGAKVRAAFGVKDCWAREVRAADVTWVLSDPGHRCTVVTIPHPSGRSMAWNDPGARARARTLLRHVAPHFPWGAP